MSLPLVKLPKHEATIPSTGAKIKYVPYTISQEKILLVASESGDETQVIDSVRETISECFSGVDVTALTTFDIDYLFIQLRIQSVSNTSQLYFRSLQCGKTGEECEKTIKMNIDLNDIKVQTYDETTNDYTPYQPENLTKDGKQIQISENIGVTIKYPGFAEQEKFAKLKNGSEDDLIKLCITTLYDEESVYTRDDFDDEELDLFYDSIPPKQLDELRVFIRNTPRVRYKAEFVCKECGLKEPILFDKFEDFSAKPKLHGLRRLL